MSEQEITTGRLLLVEYERLKDEQKSRIMFRDSLLYATLASMATVIGATINSPRYIGLPLLLPPVCLVLGWTYLVNDQKVSAIGRYIREELAPRLETLVGGDVVVFGWEVSHRTDRHRESRKLLQLTIDLVTFCVPPVGAIVVFWLRGGLTVALTVVSAAELVAVIILGLQIIRYLDRSGRNRTGPTPKTDRGKSGGIFHFSGRRTGDPLRDQVRQSSTDT
jgi:hypothetical protein